MKVARTAVILAGGKGLRLRSVVNDRPKVLADVKGRPFLAYLLDQAASAGIKRTILCVGYRAGDVQVAFGKTFAGMDLLYSREIELLGTGGALRLALPLLEDEVFLGMNGDSFCDVNLEEVWRSHHERRAKATIVVTEREDVRRYGQVTVADEGLVVAFREKEGTVGPGWVNAGIYVLAKNVIEQIPPHSVVSLERDVLPGCIGNGLFGYKSGGSFLDIGTPESYRKAAELFSKGKE